jgi:hypothetical protein
MEGDERNDGNVEKRTHWLPGDRDLFHHGIGRNRISFHEEFIRQIFGDRVRGCKG